MHHRIPLLCLRFRGAVAGAVAVALALAVLPPARAALPSAYFPAETAEPTNNEGWKALAEEFPRWVKLVRPSRTREIDAPAATQVAINEKISYVRVRRLQNDLENIKAALAHPGLVVDLRYVHGDRNDTIRLGQLLARQQVYLEAANATTDDTIVIAANSQRSAAQTTLVVVNGGTSGPVEALLDALQAQGDVLLVGARTAGDTGLYRRPEAAPGWQVIYGDLRRRAGPSLLDVGVEPGLTVTVDPAAEEAAYLGLDGGTVLTHLLDAPVDKTRFDEERLLQQFDESHPDSASRRSEQPRPDHGKQPADNDEQDEETPAEIPFDRSLHRAVSTLLALEALGRL